MIEVVRIVADWLQDAIDGVNPRLAGATLYRCTDANATGVSYALATILTPTVGPFTVSFRLYQGTAARTQIRCTRQADGVQIFYAVITWSGTTPIVTMTTLSGQPAGTLVSSTLVYPGAYDVVVSGTVLTGDTHALSVQFAGAAGSATGTVGLGNWTLSTGSWGTSADMTTWTLGDGAAVAAVTWPALDLDSGDSAPAAITVYDDSRNGIVARRRWPQGYGTLPALLVYNAGQTWPGGKTQALRRGDATVGISLLVAEPDTEEGIEDISYLWRAVLRAIDALSEAAHENDRKRAQVWLEYIDHVEFPPVEPWIEDVLIAAEMRVVWKVRNLAP
jgi:hypothetical protein